MLPAGTTASAGRPSCGPGVQQAVDDLVDRAVAAEGDDDVEAVERGLVGQLDGVAAVGGLGDVELDLAGEGVGDDVAGAGGGGRRLGVHDQQRAHRPSLPVPSRPCSARLAALLAVEGVALVAVGVVYAVVSRSDDARTGHSPAAALFAVLAGVVLLAAGPSGRPGARAGPAAPAVVLNVFPLPVALTALQGGAWYVALPLLLLPGTVLYLFATPDLREVFRER